MVTRTRVDHGYIIVSLDPNVRAAHDCTASLWEVLARKRDVEVDRVQGWLS